MLQSDIDAKGFRSLQEGAEVEFTAERTEDNRLKATLVTGPGGTPVKVRHLVSSPCSLDAVTVSYADLAGKERQP